MISNSVIEEYKTAAYDSAAVSYSFYFVRTALQQVWTVIW